MFIFPHGATVDRDGNLWVTDARGEGGKGHQVFKFSTDGKVLMTLGKAGVSGSAPDLFDQPTDVVVAPNGNIFVTDSHRNGKNNRVVKFDKNGKFLKEWGRKGSGPGEFSEPHTIAMDSRGRLFVGDRKITGFRSLIRMENFWTSGTSSDAPAVFQLRKTIRSTLRIPNRGPIAARMSFQESRRVFASAVLVTVA